LSIFQSFTIHVDEALVPHTLSALPSSNSCAVPVPSTPGTPNKSIVFPLGSNNAMNVAKAVMNALTSLQDVRVVAKKRGKTPKTLFDT